MYNFDKLYENNNVYIKVYDVKKKIGVDLRHAIKLCNVSTYTKGDGVTAAQYIDSDGLSKVAEYYLSKSGQKKANGRKLLEIVNECRSAMFAQNETTSSDGGENGKQEADGQSGEFFEMGWQITTPFAEPTKKVEGECDADVAVFRGVVAKRDYPLSDKKSDENHAVCANYVTFDAGSLMEFDNDEFGAIRVVMDGDEILFAGKDVATTLGYKNTTDAIIKHVPELDKKTVFIESTSGKQSHIFINESGLYRLIFSSKLEGAVRFTRWVTSEVLPSVRKHGAYMTKDTLEKAVTDPDFLIKLATQLKEERDKRAKLEKKVELDAPKVEFAETVSDRCDGIPLGAFAKILHDKHGINIGRNRLFQWMRDNGYITYQDRLPYQKFMNRGWFTVVEKTNPDSGTVYNQTNITGAGQVALLQHIVHDFKS